MSDLALWARLLDCALGLFMWLFWLQALLTLILPDNSRFGPLLALKKVTQPLSYALLYITPSFIIPRLHALIAGIWLFIIRFYVTPTAIGYEIEKFSDMPLENLISAIIAALFG